MYSNRIKGLKFKSNKYLHNQTYTVFQYETNTFWQKEKSNDHEVNESESEEEEGIYTRREVNRWLSASSSTSRSWQTFHVASGRTTHVGRRVAGGDRPAWYRTTNSGAAGAAVRCNAAARSLARSLTSSSWSTTRDCAVITAACGRKHVGTQGIGGSSAFVRIGGCARAYVCRRCIVCAQRPVGIHTSAQRDRERGTEGRRATPHKSDPSQNAGQPPR